MVKGAGVFAAISIAVSAWPLCGSGVLVQKAAHILYAPNRCIAMFDAHQKPLAHHHNKAHGRTGFVPRLRVFVGWHGFLLIIRGFVKVAVCNAGVIEQ